MTEFRPARSATRDVDMIEVWVDGEFKAAIYPADNDAGVRIITRHFQSDPKFVEYGGASCWEFTWK